MKESYVTDCHKKTKRLFNIRLWCTIFVESES